jgi:hypothetical protein
MSMRLISVVAVLVAHPFARFPVLSPPSIIVDGRTRQIRDAPQERSISPCEQMAAAAAVKRAIA